MRFVSQIDLFAAPLQRSDEDAPAVLEIPVLPEGTFEHEWYGLLKWTPEKFEEMIRNFDRGVTGFQPMLNFDHSTFNPFASNSPAAGWFKSLEHRPGVGLFATVELTDLGEEAVRKRRYRYISAEVADSHTTSAGDTFANVILGAALTNTPFHDTMPGLFGKPQAPARCFSQTGPHAFWAVDPAGKPATGGSMTLLERLRKRFSLPDTATEEEVATAVERAAPPPAADTATDTLSRQSVPEGMVLMSQADAERLSSLEAQVQTLSKQAEDARKALQRKEAEDKVRAFVAEGALLPKQQESAVELAISNPELFQKLYADAAPVIDLSRRGLREQDQPNAETFAGLVEQYQRQGLGYADAAKRAAQERPDLYTQYRQGGQR